MTHQDWEKLAGETYRWMKTEGYVHDYKQQTRSHCTRADWLDEFGNAYSIVDTDWITTVQHMFMLGHTVGFDVGKGFFLCSPEDSATYITRLINMTASLMSRVHQLIGAMEAGGQWPQIADGLAGRVYITDVRQIASAMEDMGVLVNNDVKVALEDAQRLLAIKHAQPPTNTP